MIPAAVLPVEAKRHIANGELNLRGRIYFDPSLTNQTNICSLTTFDPNFVLLGKKSCAPTYEFSSIVTYFGHCNEITRFSSPARLIRELTALLRQRDL